MSNQVNSTIETKPIYLDFSGDVIADVIRYAGVKNAVADYRASVAASVADLIKKSGVPAPQAIKALRAELVAGGLAKQRVSEVLLDLGIRERAASKKTTGKAADKKAELQPVVDALIALASEKAGADAASVLRRAYTTLLAKSASAAA